MEGLAGALLYFVPCAGQSGEAGYIPKSEFWIQFRRAARVSHENTSWCSRNRMYGAVCGHTVLWISGVRQEFTNMYTPDCQWA